MEDNLLVLLSYVAPLLGVSGAALIFLRRAVFYIKVVRQAVAAFEEFKVENRRIYLSIQADPGKQELAHVLAGGVKKIEGLTGISQAPR